MDKRQTKSLIKQLHRHARKTCAYHNETDGCQLTQHGKCVYSFDADRPTSNVCPYFMKSVGPAEPKLFDDYLQHFPDDYPLKPEPQAAYEDFCAKCGEGYERNSNRQVYCRSCAAEIRRNKERIRQQEKRAGIR